MVAKTVLEGRQNGFGGSLKMLVGLQKYLEENVG